MGHKPITIRHKLITKRKNRTPSEFGKNLLSAREQIPLTQKDLSEETAKLGTRIHPNTIYHIEKGITEIPSKRAVQILKKVVSNLVGCEYPWTDDGKLLDKASLASYIMKSEVVARIDFAIAAASKSQVVPADSFVEIYVNRMEHVGIKSIEEIERELKQRERFIALFGQFCYESPLLRLPMLARGFCIAALQVVLLLEKHDLKGLIAFLKDHSLERKISPTRRARAMKSAYNSARNKLNRR